MKRLAAAIIPLVITGGLILPSAWAEAKSRCNAETLKGYNAASKLELPAKDSWNPAKEKTLTDLAKAVGCSPAVLRYIVFNGVGAPVFNEYLRSIQNEEVEKVGKNFDGLDAMKVKLDAKVTELNAAIERFKKSSTDNVSATEKIELLGKILACKPGPDAADKKPRCEMTAATKSLETDLAKTQAQPALKGGTLFGELDLAYWMLGDHALLTALIRTEPGWQEDGAGLFVPGSMKALKNVLMGADAAKVPAAVDSEMGLDLHSQWEDSRDALNEFFKQFGDSAKLEAAYGLIEKAKAKEDEADAAAKGRIAKIEGAKLPSTLAGQLDTELLSRVFDNKKAAGELSEYANFEEWKSKKGPEAEAELKRIKMAAGLIDAEGKPVAGAGFQIGSDGREILFTPKGAKTPDKIKVDFAGENVDAKKDYSKDIAAIADKILQRSPGAAQAAALRLAVQKAGDGLTSDYLKTQGDIVRRGGLLGPLGIPTEAYSAEELASKNQLAMDKIAGQYSALRQNARTTYKDAVSGYQAELDAAKKKCLADARGTTEAEVTAAADKCMKDGKFQETFDTKKTAAFKKLSDRMGEVGMEEDTKGMLMQSQATQIALTNRLWNDEFAKSLATAKGYLLKEKIEASDGYLKTDDVNAFWTATWAESAGDAYATRMSDLRQKVLKSPLTAVAGTVKGTVVKEFNEWWAPKLAERRKIPRHFTPGTGGISDSDAALDEQVRQELLRRKAGQK